MIHIIFIIILLIVLFLCIEDNKEHFSDGTAVQLLTSKPYYTWYDYLTKFNPYRYDYNYHYRYPFYKYPIYRYSFYKYPVYRHPYYNPVLY